MTEHEIKLGGTGLKLLSSLQTDVENALKHAEMLHQQLQGALKLAAVERGPLALPPNFNVNTQRLAEGVLVISYEEPEPTPDPTPEEE